jgi:transcriptional regulator with GAF, ATPase, and Fis domain
LSKTKGNQSAAARFLGTTKRILTYKIHKHGIDCEQFRLRRNVKEH